MVQLSFLPSPFGEIPSGIINAVKHVVNVGEGSHGSRGSLP